MIFALIGHQMHSVKIRSGLCVLVLCGSFLGGCSDTSPASKMREQYIHAPEFSSADKAAARALSLGDERSLEKLKEPGAQAAACSQAIGEIATKLREADGISAEQIAVLDRARQIYEDRIPPARKNSAQPLAMNSSDPDDQVDPDAASVKSGQTAIVCLRNLQDE